MISYALLPKENSLPQCLHVKTLVSIKKSHLGHFTPITSGVVNDLRSTRNDMTIKFAATQILIPVEID